MVRDVVVVGAGPAGIAAAKRCSEAGLKTLLLEKFPLPRKKVCDGTMAPGAQALVRQEYGEIPASVACDPPWIDGLVFYTPTPVPYGYATPWVWRSKFDYWMCQKAMEKGVELWEEALLTGFLEAEKGYSLYLEREGKKEEVHARYIIGADGATSRVRKTLFPGLQLPMLQQGHEHFEGELDLDRKWYHEFLHPEPMGLGLYSVYNKDEFFVIGYAAFMGKLGELMEEAHGFLQKYGFNPQHKPVWEGRCYEPICGGELGSHQFRPAKGDVLLAGDAGGMMMHVSMEGIGPGISSGLRAADSVKEAIETGKPAGEIYLSKLEPMIDLLRKAHEYELKITEARESGDNETWVKLLRQAETEDFYNDY